MLSFGMQAEIFVVASFEARTWRANYLVCLSLWVSRRAGNGRTDREAEIAPALKASCKRVHMPDSLPLEQRSHAGAHVFTRT